MLDDAEQDLDGVIAGVTFFFLGLLVPVLFLAMAQGLDTLSFLVIFGGYTACILFGEFYLTLMSGMAFGTGLVMTSLASFDWWFAGLAVAGTVVNIARYATSNPTVLGLEGEEDIFESSASGQ